MSWCPLAGLTWEDEDVLAMAVWEQQPKALPPCPLGPGLPARPAVARLQAGPASTAPQPLSRPYSLAETSSQTEITSGKASIASFRACG